MATLKSYKYRCTIQAVDLLFDLLLLCLSYQRCCNAYPTGAGGCAGNRPAVGAPHTTVPGQRGSLRHAGYELLVDGIPIVQKVVVEAGKEHALTIRGGRGYRGILFRLESVDTIDTTGILRPTPGNSNLQRANVCEAPVVGVTHTNDLLKNNLSVIFDTDDTASFVLDVTVVILNNSANSTYFYSQYQIDTIDATSISPSAAVTIFPSIEKQSQSPTVVPSVVVTIFSPVKQQSGSPTLHPIISSISPTSKMTTTSFSDEPSSSGSIAPTKNSNLVSHHSNYEPTTSLSLSVNPTNESSSQFVTSANSSAVSTSTPTTSFFVSESIESNIQSSTTSNPPMFSVTSENDESSTESSTVNPTSTNVTSNTNAIYSTSVFRTISYVSVLVELIVACRFGHR
jgi:hypothetical protein